MSARADTIAEHERMRGEAYCKRNHLTFYATNEEGVWWSKQKFQSSTGTIVDSHGCTSWEEVNEDFAMHVEKFRYLDDEAERVRLDDTPQDSDARDEL